MTTVDTVFAIITGITAVASVAGIYALVKHEGEKKVVNVARINETAAGFELVSPTCEFVGVYTRKRDAVRGATRRGFVIA